MSQSKTRRRLMLAALVLVYAAIQLSFTILVLRNFFDALPSSLFEAALLCSGSS